MPRRKAGALVDLEAALLAAGLEHTRAGERFHGFAIAESLGDGKRLIGHGTLYKALARLQQAELLEAVWEEPEAAALERRPRRKLYTVTTAGAQALAAHRAGRASTAALGSPAAGTA